MQRRFRLHACVSGKGGHFQHINNLGYRQLSSQLPGLVNNFQRLPAFIVEFLKIKIAILFCNFDRDMFRFIFVSVNL